MWLYTSSDLKMLIMISKSNHQPQILKGLCHTSYLSQKPREFSCKFFLAGVNFYRFNAKKWQFTVYFAVIMQKLAIYCVFCRNNAKNWQFSVYFVVIYAFFGVNFILQKFCLCKKNDKYEVWICIKLPEVIFECFALLYIGPLMGIRQPCMWAGSWARAGSDSLGTSTGVRLHRRKNRLIITWCCG